MADKDGLRTVGSSRSSSSHSSIGEDSTGTPDALAPSPSGVGLSPRKPSTGFQCQLCTLVASSQSALDEHMNIHTGTRPYQCLECGFSCSLHSTLQQHLAVHRIEMSSSVMLERHMPDINKVRDLPPPLLPEVTRGLPVHVTTSGPPAIMDGLNSLSSMPAFSEHGRVYQCKLCTHISPTKTHLNEHMNIHSGKKPYKCLVCGFSSAFRSSLMRHLIVHTGTSKQFKCDQCHYQTPYKCNLQAHRRKRHSMTDSCASLPPISMAGDSSPTYSQNNASTPPDDGMYKSGRYPIDGKAVSLPLSDTSGSQDDGPPPLTQVLPNRDGSPYDGPEDGLKSSASLHTGNGKILHSASIPLPQSELASAETLSPQKASPGSSTGLPQDTPAQDALDFSSNTVPQLTTSEVHDSGDSNHSAPSRGSTVTSNSLVLASNSVNSMTNTTPLSPQQSLPPNDMSVANAPHWANFPIFKRKKEGGAKKRKRTPIPKRELLLSPEREHATELWIDTRSDVTPTEGQIVAAYPSGIHQLSLKAEEMMSTFPHQAVINGMDLAPSPRDMPVYKYPPGVVPNARSPGDVTPDDSDENMGQSRPFYDQGGFDGEQITNNGDFATSATQTEAASRSAEDGKMDGQAQTEWIGGDHVGIPQQAIKCPHCETFFTDHVIFTLHMSCHGSRHPFQCSICGYVCRDKIEFTCHVTRSQHIS